MDPSEQFPVGDVHPIVDDGGAQGLAERPALDQLPVSQPRELTRFLPVQGRAVGSSGNTHKCLH